MPVQLRHKAYFAMAAGLLLWSGTLFLTVRFDKYGNWSVPLINTILSTGIAIQMLGCGMYGKSRGRTAWNCMWGIHPVTTVIGFIVLTCQKDLTRDADNPLVNGGPRGFDVQPVGEQQ